MKNKDTTWPVIIRNPKRKELFQSSDSRRQICKNGRGEGKGSLHWTNVEKSGWTEIYELGYKVAHFMFQKVNHSSTLWIDKWRNCSFNAIDDNINTEVKKKQYIQIRLYRLFWITWQEIRILCSVIYFNSNSYERRHIYLFLYVKHVNQSMKPFLRMTTIKR